MSESKEHSNLVGILHCYIAERFCAGDRGQVLTDSDDIDSFDRPPYIAGFIPDAYLRLEDLGRVIIGEAKSFRDLENAHTEAQIIAFLRRCGMVKGSLFILAVPWPLERLARVLLTNFQGREQLHQVATVVLSEANTTGTASTTGKLLHCRS